MGFRIALDDAGAGNAGLEMLSQLSVDFVKIDRAVVVGALTEQAAHSVFVGLTTIARESHIAWWRKALKTQRCLSSFNRPRCHTWQGYLLGRPDEAFPVNSALQDLSALLFTGAH